MKTIKAIIERNSDGEYSVYCVDEMFSGMGATAEAAKADMLSIAMLSVRSPSRLSVAVTPSINSSSDAVTLTVILSLSHTTTGEVLSLIAIA